MKNTLLLLLFINIFVLLWYTWIEITPDSREASVQSVETTPPETPVSRPAEASPDNQLAETSAAADEPAIEAIGSADQFAASAEPTAEASNANAAASAEVCFVSEPLRSGEKVLEYQRVLQAGGIAATLSQKDAQVLMGQWVRAEGFTGAAEAKAAARELKAQGIADGYALADRDSPDAWLVSLGIFRNSDSASRLAEQARSAGFNVMIRPRYESTAAFQLSFGGSADDLAAVLAASELPGQYVDCPDN